MKIVEVRAYPQRYQEPNDCMMWRHVTLARITTDSGHVGWGECISQWPEATLAVKVLIEQGLGPAVLLGRNPLDNGALFEAMKAHSWWYGDTGMANFAISALDVALWDLKGKILEQPVYRLLGGKVCDRLRACASTHPSKADLQDLADELAVHADDGYTAVKVGFGKAGNARLGIDPNRDVAYVKTVRKTIGADVDFIVDVGNKTRWDYASGVRMARAFEEYRLRWLEDPFQPADLSAYQHLRSSIETQIGAGERSWQASDYQRLIDLGVADIFLVDPGRAEGITGYKRVMDLTAQAHLFFNAHSWSSAINTAASLHATVTGVNHIVFELKPVPGPMQDELVREPFKQRDGWVTVPDNPGLGVEIDENVVERYGFSSA